MGPFEVLSSEREGLRSDPHPHKEPGVEALRGPFSAGEPETGRCQEPRAHWQASLDNERLCPERQSGEQVRQTPAVRF